MNGIPTVIAVLLLVILSAMMHQDKAGPELLSPAYAQPQAGGSNWVFFPVGNQEVYRLVIWDKNTNTVYDYDRSGKVANTRVITAPGEWIEKR